MNLATLQTRLAHFSELDVDCETCHAEPGVPCKGRSPTGHVPPHAPRRRKMQGARAELERLVQWEFAVQSRVALRAPDAPPPMRPHSSRQPVPEV